MHIPYAAKRIRRTTWLWAGAILFVLAALGVGLYTLVVRQSAPAHAAGGLTFSLYATHPYASQAGFDSTSRNYYTNQLLCTDKPFCPVGQTLRDMEVTDDGHLVAGYGDWNANVDSFGVPAGRVGVVPLNLSNAIWGSMFFTGTEANDVVRKINGKLYVPTSDPSDRAATGNPSGSISGYATNDTGAWRFVSNAGADIHTLDVATLNGSDLWTVGSHNDKSVARRSLDNGATWTTEVVGPGIVGNELERFYWAAAINNKLYMQSYGESNTRVFDGTSWTTGPGFAGCEAILSQYVSVFDNKILCAPTWNMQSSTPGKFKAFDGTAVSEVTFGTSSSYLRDVYIDGSYLYVLASTGIYRSQSLAGPWQQLADYSIPEAYTMAIYNDTIYLGGTNGRIWKASVQTASAPAVSFSADECFTFNSATGTITKYNFTVPGCTTDITIPDEIGGVAVTAIGDSAFSDGLHSVTSVTFPNTLKTIGNLAFRGNKITTLVLPDSVETVGNEAFGYTGSGTGRYATITSLTLSNSLKTIGIAAFGGHKIESVTIPASVTAIGDYAFDHNAITALDIQANSIAFGTGVFGFNQISQLPAYFSQSNITTFPSSIFTNNAFTSLTVPSNITSTGALAFGYNPINQLILPAGLQTIGSGAFWYNAINSVDIPSTVTTVGAQAFQGNPLATLVKIPASVTTMGDLAFALVPNPAVKQRIASVTIDSQAAMNKISSIFQGRVMDDVTIGGSVTTVRSLTNRQIKTVTLGSSVTTIDPSALSNNQLTELTIPSSVTSIGSGALAANQLTSFTVPGTLATVGAGVLSSNPLATITYNGTVYSGADALTGKCLTYNGTTGAVTGVVSNPDHLTLVKNDGYACFGKQKLIIPATINGVTITSVGNYAYQDKQFVSVEIADTVTMIGTNAFSGNKLTSVTIPASVTSVGNSAFEGNPLETVYIHGITTLGTNALLGSDPAVASAIQAEFGACIAAMSPPPATWADYIPCYQQVYTQDKYTGSFIRVYADHPEHYTDTLYEDPTAAFLGIDGPITGGFVINPAALSVQFTDVAGRTIAPTLYQTGPKLTDYAIRSFVAAYPQATADDMATAFYRQGQSVTFTPPAIQGFVAPEARTAVLSNDEAATSLVFVYARAGVIGEVIDVLAPLTGARSPLTAIAALVLAAVAVIAGGLVWRRRRN